MKVRWDDNLGYWLFYSQRRVAYAFSEVLKQCCQEHEKPYVITPPQWGVLALLYESGNSTIGSISQRRGLDAPTITGIVKRLEQGGLVERLHDRGDRRVVNVDLTGEGRSFMPVLSEAVDAFNDILTRGLSGEEQRDLLAKLQHIIVNVSAVAPGTGDRFGLLPPFLLCETRE